MFLMKKAVGLLLHIPIIYISDCGKLQQTFAQAAGQTTNTGQVSSIVTIMCRNDELSWLFNNRFRTTKYMKLKRMRINNRNFKKDLAIFCK